MKKWLSLLLALCLLVSVLPMSLAEVDALASDLPSQDGLLEPPVELKVVELGENNIDETNTTSSFIINDVTSEDTVEDSSAPVDPSMLYVIVDPTDTSKPSITPTPTPEPTSSSTYSELEISANIKKTITVGDTLQLIPRGQSAKSYSSSSSKIATVNPSGLVKALKDGKTTINITLMNKKKIKLTLTVQKPTTPSSITINNTEPTIAKGTTRQLSVSMSAVKSNYQAQSKLTWKSSKSSIIAVDKKGKITAKKVGNATITVTTENKLTSSIILTVAEPSKPKTIAINKPNIEYLGIKDSLQLEVTMTADKEPVAAKLTWKSSKSNIASVDKNGKVTGKKEGTTTITVKTDNGLSAFVDVTVKDIHAPTSIAIEPLPVNRISIDEIILLKTVMTAIDEPISKLSWNSTNSKVASVDKDGFVKGKQKGITTISVKTNNGLSAKIDIEVNDSLFIDEFAFDNAFLGNNKTENWIIRLKSIELSRDIYGMTNDAAGMKTALEDLGFHNLEAHVNPAVGFFDKEHKVGYVFGTKDINNKNGGKTRLYVIVIRGTGGPSEWASDFTLGFGQIHDGFDIPAKEIMKTFNKYLNEYPASDYRVWITGHSRGAAVANLLAGEYFPQYGIPDANTFCYTFACPNVKKGEIARRSHILNYNLGGDLVPRVPFTKWGYGRYGRTCTLNNFQLVENNVVIKKSTMDILSSYLANCSSIEINSALEYIKEELTKQGKAFSGGVAEMLLVGIIKDLFGPGTISVQKALFASSISETIFLIYFTHRSETYYDWIKGLWRKECKFDK